ncbi:MAG TPA: hypothetical protein PKE59_06060, partial [Novosphingobium sp.]|nr:hypothetical protein [Novosphingobium sp.]
MTTKIKLSLLAASAIALVATQAGAQVVGTLTAGPTANTANGNNLCSDGTTAGGYTTVNGTTLDGTITVAGADVVSTTCADFTATTSYGTFFFGAASVLGDPGTVLENGSASTSYDFAREFHNVADTSTFPPTPLGSSTADTPITPVSSGAYSYGEVAATDQQNLHVSITNVNGTGTTGTGSQVTYTQSAANTDWQATTGTSTFDPVTGNVTYTPTAGKSALQNIDGNTVTVYDTVAGTSSSTNQNANGFSATTNGTTTTFNSAGVTTTGSSLNLQANGPSYVNVGTNDVTIHGGTTSTTAVWNNSGYTQTDTVNGVTFTVDNNGNVQNLGNNTVGGNLQVNGNANVAGFTTTNGIDNTGNIETDTL